MFYGIDFDKVKELFVYNPSDPLLFNSSLFLFLFLGFILFYRIFSNSNLTRIIAILVFSIFFYYKASGYYFVLLFVTAFVNYYAGKQIFLMKEGSGRRLLFIITLIINLGLLGYFKYTNFFLEIVSDIQGNEFSPYSIFLPIGISFFTFKALSYVIDIYLETLEPTKKLRDFCLYIFFFPNILAGPIDRASAFLPQINNKYFLSKADIGKALVLIMGGLLKKTVIADYISLNFVDRVFEFPDRFTGVENLLAVYGYTLQIYCDFSGYSDMAIGIGLLLGFKLMDNFNSPFKATSVADFWRRWHISLSTWLLDYLFRPLQMKFRNMKIWGNVTALIITFLLCGLWHGASWLFVFWGALHGFYMAFSVLTKKPRQFLLDKLNLSGTKFWTVVQIIITFHLLAFSLLFFRAPSFDFALIMIDQIINYFHAPVFLQFVEGYQTIFIVIVCGYVLHFLPKSWEEKTMQVVGNSPIMVQALFLTAAIWFAIQFKSADIQPFIYFQY